MVLKTGSVKDEETWTGSLSHTSDAVDEKDLNGILKFSSVVQIWL